jgi:hypothetical protein
VFYFETVQLKDKLAVCDQLFVSGPAVVAPAAKQTLIPAATCLYIGDDY